MHDPVSVSRQLSVGDLMLPLSSTPLGLSMGSLGNLSMGSLGNLSAFHKVDSESDFLAFLKRIPSSNVLDTSHQQLQPSSLQNAPSLGTPGFMPRVPSLPALASGPLDLLQVLAVQQQQQQPAAPAVKLEPLAGGPAYLPSELASLSTAINPPHQSPGLQPALGHQALGALPQASARSQPAAPSINNASHSGQNSGPTSSHNDIEHDQWTGNKADDRRARRMLSNRESARRSRRRKQQHLGQLESEVSALIEEKKIWAEKIAALERRFGSAEDENKRLRSENERLLDELRFLRSELKDISSYARRCAAEEKDQDAHRNKKAKADGDAVQ